MMLHWAMLAAAITTSMVGQTLLKAGAGAPDFTGQVLDRSTSLMFTQPSGLVPA